MDIQQQSFSGRIGVWFGLIMIYLIGTILELVVLVMSAFAPVLYTRSWEYGKITGIGKVFNQGDKISYDLFSIMGVWYIIVIVVVAANAIVFLAFYIKKMSHNIPGLALSIVYSLPLLFIIIGRSILGNDAKFIGNSTATYGTGYSSGFTGLGWLVLVLMILAIILTIAGIFNQRSNNEINSKNEVKIIKNTNAQKKAVKEDEFKMWLIRRYPIMEIFLLIKTIATVVVVLDWWFQIIEVKAKSNHWWFKAFLTIEAIGRLIDVWGC